MLSKCSIRGSNTSWRKPSEPQLWQKKVIISHSSHSITGQLAINLLPTPNSLTSVTDQQLDIVAYTVPQSPENSCVAPNWMRLRMSSKDTISHDTTKTISLPCRQPCACSLDTAACITLIVDDFRP